jgi:hypothetical protein
MRAFRLVALIAALIALSACGGSPAAPATTAAQSAVPLADLDLAPLLVQSGDLPAGLNGAQIENTMPTGLRGFPTPVKAIDQHLQRNGDTAGHVVVLLYEADSDVESAFRVAVGEGKTSDPQHGVGDVARIWQPNEIKTRSRLAFTRCHAYVDITFGQATIDEVTAYAKRLDQRLQPLTCR